MTYFNDLDKRFDEKFPSVKNPRLGIVESDIPTAKQSDIKSFFHSEIEALIALAVKEGEDIKPDKSEEQMSPTHEAYSDGYRDAISDYQNLLKQLISK